MKQSAYCFASSFPRVDHLPVCVPVFHLAVTSVSPHVFQRDPNPSFFSDLQFSSSLMPLLFRGSASHPWSQQLGGGDISGFDTSTTSWVPKNSSISSSDSNTNFFPLEVATRSCIDGGGILVSFLLHNASIPVWFDVSLVPISELSPKLAPSFICSMLLSSSSASKFTFTLVFCFAKFYIKEEPRIGE